MDLTVVPIHKYPEYIMDCCELINEEWKRSVAARMHSLETSCDQLPTSLILLCNKRLIGHLKLSAIPSIREACFVETVVIDSKLRGKGYGTLLMNRAEEYCKDFLNLNTIYLSTRGQELFYRKLGYTKCSPISIYGSYTPPTTPPRPKIRMIKHIYMPPPPPPPLPVNKIMPVNNSTKIFMKKHI